MRNLDFAPLYRATVGFDRIADLMDRVLTGKIRPGKVFDMDIPLARVAEGYQAMDERRAVKVLLRVE